MPEEGAKLKRRTTRDVFPWGPSSAARSVQRRRWESNPLEPGCSRSPGRLAPASRESCPRQELNLVLDLRRVVCESGTPRGRRDFSIPRPGIEPGLAASKTAVRPTHSRGSALPMPLPGIEPGLQPSEGRVRIRHTPRATCLKQGRKDLNPVREFWRLAALPGARPCQSRSADQAIARAGSCFRNRDQLSIGTTPAA